jgi:hypothetical protein
LTISSTTRIAGPFVGNGTASVFPFTFKVFTAADLQVIRLIVSSGIEQQLVLNSDYTVTLNGNQNTNPGGNITLTAGALQTGYTLTITSDISNLQPTDLTNQGGFYPEVITDSLDRATIQIQQISDIGDRAIKVPLSDGAVAGLTLPTAVQRANAFLAFDAAGDPVAVTGGTSGAPATVTRQTFSGDGTTVSFTLASAPGGLGNSALVYINGICQERSTYSIGGTTLLFSQAPVAGTNNIEFVNFLTTNIGTTDANLVQYTPSGTGATAITAQTKFAERVSVKDFGAVGNGVTDDTTAFTNAIAVAGTRDIFVPGGSYVITGTVTGNFYSDATVTITGGTVNTINRIGSTLSTTGNATITGDLAVNGGDITTTSVGTASVFNTNATTLNVGGAATAVALGATTGTVSVGNFSMNAGYGSIAPVYGCRAWVTWNGTTTTTTCPWGGGGTATVERASGSSTATITTSANHNMLSGHRVYAISAIATDSYTITVTAPNQFTVTTAATTLIAAGTPITLQWYTIQASGNVHSVSDDTPVGRAYVNWATAFPDANYSVHVTSTQSGTTATPLIAGTIGADPPTTTTCPILVFLYTGGTNTGGFTSVTAFR